MYKKILIAILLCFGGKAIAQPSQYTPMTANGYQMKRVKVDSTLHIPSFCGFPSLNGTTSPMGALAYDTCNNKLYKHNTEFGWTEVGSSDFIDTIFRRNDSVFAKKNGRTLFQFKDSTGGGGPGTTPTLQQVLTAGSTVTANNTISGNTRTQIQQNGTASVQARLVIDTATVILSNQIQGTGANLQLAPNGALLTSSAALLSGDVVVNSTNSSLRYRRAFPSFLYQFGIDINGAFFANGPNLYRFPLGSGTTGQILKLTSPTQLAWANDSSGGGGSTDTTSLSNRIDERVKYTDTASMLSNYLTIADTANQFVNSVTKVNDSTIRVIKGTSTTDITITTSSVVTSATRLVTTVYNNTGATITKGSVVYISGRHSSNLPTIAKAQANNESNSYKTFALVGEDIADNASGLVIQAGNIGGLNLPTSGFTDGDIVYLSPTTAGGLTITKPLAPNHICKIGSITRAHPTQGSIEIKIENGWQLDELSDVSISAVPADSVILQFSRVDSLWHDVTITNAIGNRYIKPNDTSVFARKQVPAYSIQANNTNAAANASSIFYKDTSGTYTQSPNWNGTAPTTITATYRWTRIGRRVDLNITLIYATPGSLNNTLLLPIPTDAPTPAEPLGATGNSNYLYPIYSIVNTNLTTLTNSQTRGGLRKNSGGTGYEIFLNFTTLSASTAYVNLTYWTN